MMEHLPSGPWAGEWCAEHMHWLLRTSDELDPFATLELHTNDIDAEAIVAHLAASWQTARDLATARAFIVRVHDAWRAWWNGDGAELVDMGPAFDDVMSEWDRVC